MNLLKNTFVGHLILNNSTYFYKTLQANISYLEKMYPFLYFGIIGSSVLRRPIPYIRIGNGKRKVCYCAAFHANEWITCPILMEFVEDFSKAYIDNNRLNNYDIESIFNTSSIYIVPMVNPDGVDLVTGNLNCSSVIYNNIQKIANTYTQISFPSGWKANIEGVDLKNYQPIYKVL